MAFLRPGQGFKDYIVFEKTTVVSKAGSVGRSANFVELDTLKGITTSMSPQEIETWKQTGYEVSDKVVQYGPSKAKKGQYLLVFDEKKHPHIYEIKGIRNPGNLDHFSVYIVNERSDLQIFNQFILAASSKYGILVSARETISVEVGGGSND